MNKFKFVALNENELKVSIPQDAPVSHIKKLSSMLESRGLLENMAKSTKDEKFFYKKINAIDLIIEKLQKMARVTKKDGPGITTTVNWQELIKPKKKPPVNEVKQPKPSGEQNISQTNPVNVSTNDQQQDANEDIWINRQKVKGSSWRKLNKDNQSAKKNEQHKGVDRLIASTTIENNKDALNKSEQIAVNKLINAMKEKNMLDSDANNTSNLTAKPEDSWDTSITDWFKEALKPINSKFSSEQEQIDYWNSIKVDGSNDDGITGY